MGLITNHCAIHDVSEEITEEAYRWCMECGHIYNTPQEIEALYEENVARMKSQLPRSADDAIPNTKKADEISFCQFCLHDF